MWDKENQNSKYADCELAWTSFNTATRIFRYTWDGFRQGDMKHREVRIHPSHKPTALYTWIFQNYANVGDKIIDPFLGSGSSRIAAYDIGLDFWGYEIDETYFRLEEERFEKHIAQMNLFIDGEW